MPPHLPRHDGHLVVNSGDSRVSMRINGTLTALVTSDTNTKGNLIFHGRVDDRFGFLTECRHGHKVKGAARECAERTKRRLERGREKNRTMLEQEVWG